MTTMRTEQGLTASRQPMTGAQWAKECPEQLYDLIQNVARGRKLTTIAQKLCVTHNVAAEALRTPLGKRLFKLQFIEKLEVYSLPRALWTLDRIMVDKLAPASARVAAARIVMQAAGALRNSPQPVHGDYGPPDAPDAPLPSPDQVDSNLASIERAIADIRAQLTAAQPIDVTPEPNASPSDILGDL